MFPPGFPCPSEYSVTVPDGVEFSDFLVDDIIAKPSNADFNYWITGFKSQISLLPTVWATYGTKNLVDIGYKNQDGTWTDIEGSLDQVEVGQFGTFGVNYLNDLFYRVGTHENPVSAGISWQL